MLREVFAWLVFVCTLIREGVAQIPLGNWRDHLPYYQASRVIAGKNKIVCATPYSLFTIDLRDNSIERLSKTNGLHEVGISAIALNEASDRLIIAYSNSNVDIIFDNKVNNIDAIKRKDIAADKSIYDIFSYRGYAYLSTGLGVIVLDEARAEVKDTYIIGDGGHYTKVNGFAADGRSFYAATPEGLKQAGMANANLADYRNWQLISGQHGLPAGPCRQVVQVQQKTIVQRGDSLYEQTGNQWKLLYTSDWEIKHTGASANKLVLAQQLAGQSRVVILNEDGSLNKIISQPGIINDPREGIVMNEDVWIADFSGGLIQNSGSNYRQYQLNSPASVTTGEMVFSNRSLWVASGSVTLNWQNTFTKNGLYRFGEQEWINYSPGKYPVLEQLYDLVCLAVDPMDNMVYAGSFGGGLLQFNQGSTSRIFKENSAIEATTSDPDRYCVAGLAFDDARNLWVSNYGAARCLGVRKSDGTWIKFTIPFLLADNAVSQIIVDDYNQKWIVSPNGNGLVCFNHGGSLENFGDDRWKYFRSGPGNGNLPDNNVLSIAKDKNGFIWVGTIKGIGIFQCPKDVFSVGGCEAVLPVVQQDNFAGYLFRSEVVQSIQVDGADRKWIGTKNGVWLISPDGDKTIFHFRDDNSPLLDNDVRKIAIDPVSGEVFFATARGICSYRGTATEGTNTNSDVLTFPNPVPPGYTGTIAIRGLVNNALVKITELDGRLVYQTRAAGGQATWNGRDYKGRQVASGVYLVLSGDDRGNEKMVTKIVMIR